MTIVLIRTEMRDDADLEAYEALAERMDRIVRAIPGFVSATDHGDLTVVRFESHEALAAWRNEPEHVAAQRLGRERFYKSYVIEVCDLVRTAEFPPR